MSEIFTMNLKQNKLFYAILLGHCHFGKHKQIFSLLFHNVKKKKKVDKLDRLDSK